MNKIDFKNLPDTTTPLSADNLNLLQDNVEDGITDASNTLDAKIDRNATYSTTETRIGTWIDGKPLYRKIYTFPALKNNDTSELQIDSTYKIVNFDVIVKSSTDSLLYKLPFVSSTSTNLIGVYLYIAENKISVRTFGNRTNYNDNYAIVEFTKTTD